MARWTTVSSISFLLLVDAVPALHPASPPGEEGLLFSWRLRHSILHPRPASLPLGQPCAGHAVHHRRRAGSRCGSMALQPQAGAAAQSKQVLGAAQHLRKWHRM